MSVEAFSLQTDESTDISGHAQLIANIRFIDSDKIVSNFPFCKELPDRTTGDEIFRATDKYLSENYLDWKNCVSVCTDGAKSMTGNVKGFIAKVREVNSYIGFHHCLLHRETLVAKTLPPILKEVLDEVVKTVNFIKSKPLNSRLFSVLCQEMGSEHTSLLLHTEVRRLSRGKVLTRVFELRDEV
jgi:hypothetical protein